MPTKGRLRRWRQVRVVCGWVLGVCAGCNSPTPLSDMRDAGPMNEGQRTAGMAAATMPTAAMPTNSMEVRREPMAGMPTAGMPTNSMPMSGDSMTGMPTAGMPTDSTSMSGEPMATVPTAGMPADSMAMSGEAMAGAAASDDPTAPDATTGVYIPPGPDFDAALTDLLDYQRGPVGLLTCPGLLESAACGDGTCDTSAEDAQNCPADCVFHLVGAYNDLPICPAYMRVVEPKDVDETQRAVREAVAQGERIRVLGASHSANQLICGDGVALRMTQFADVSKTEIRDNIAYVQPGVRMIDLGDYLYDRNLSIGYTHLGFRGVTVAGAIGTSAHGSSPRHNSALSQRVVSLQLVLADGSLRTFEKSKVSKDLWRALTTHLGLFGVITQVGVRVEPAFNLDTRTDILDESALLDADSPLSLLADCDWGEFNWFPGQHQVLRWCGKSTDAPAEKADNVLLDPGVPSDLTPLAKLAFHAGTCGSELNALLEQARFEGLRDEPPIVVTDADGTQRHVSHAVGPAHRMMSADLIELGTNKYFQMDWEVAIPQQYMSDAIRVAHQVFDAQNVSMPGVGVFLRFTKIERGGWLSYHSAGKQFKEGQTALFFEAPVAVPAGYSESQLRDYMHVYEQLMTLFIRYYGARAHWGKNLDMLFDLQRSVGTYAGRIDKMNQAVAELDPYGVFSNAFAERIGIKWPKRGENFAAELGNSDCACDVAAEPVCDYSAHVTYANACRATCAGLASSQLITGPCDAFEFARCSPLDARTCAYRKNGMTATDKLNPVLRF